MAVPEEKRVESSEPDAAKEAEVATSERVDEAKALLSDINANIVLLKKVSESREPRLLYRVLRSTNKIRRTLTARLFKRVLAQYYPPGALRDELSTFAEKVEQASQDMDVENVEVETEESSPSSTPSSISFEVDLYLHLLLTILLIDNKLHEEAAVCSTKLVEKVTERTSINLHAVGELQGPFRRTLGPLIAKAYFYYARSHELLNRLAEIRGTLLAALRTATLRHDDESQATLLNLLLRNYLHFKLFDQADKLLSKSSFPENASSNQIARFLYYQGKIKSVQLAYTDAYNCLLQAGRKAPQTSATGFRREVAKLSCIVQLLMGEVPEKAMFRQPGLTRALNPYAQLTQAVRVGDVVEFHSVADKYKDTFIRDDTYTLIQRLHHNVIKTGLRKINLSYSRIYLSDVCEKLHLESIEDAEYIVAKAIRDGVIDATIDHENKILQSKENIDIYSTHEPQEAFHKRIAFCLSIHNEAVKAMRYPPDAHKPQRESEEVRKERIERGKELEKIAEEEGQDDDF